jgi:hypothetical protein
MLRSTLVILAVICLFPAVAGADEAEAFNAGLALGAVGAEARAIAADLFLVDRLASEYILGQADATAADPLAAGATTYAIWQVKLSILPACDARLEDGGLDGDGLQPVRGDLRKALEGVRRSGQVFLAAVEAGDALALTTLVNDLNGGDYVNKLQRIADRAGQIATPSAESE